MGICKDCEWFILLEDDTGLCCCPDQSEGEKHSSSNHKKVDINTKSCEFFSKEINEKEKIEETTESEIMNILEEHAIVLNDVQMCIDKLFFVFRPVLQENVSVSLKKVHESFNIVVSDIPIARDIQKLTAQLVKIQKSLEILIDHSGF